MSNKDDDVLVRPFEADDQESARSLIVSGLGEHFGFIDETLNPDLHDIMAQYVAPGHIFLVAVDGSTLVGTGALVADALHKEVEAHLVRVSVHPAYRGRGIGRKIVEQLLHAARQRGYRRILVETNSGWQDAIGLYKRLGFREYPRNTKGGVYMELELA